MSLQMTLKRRSVQPHVVVEVDKTTDVTNKAQISVILRYAVKTDADCEVKEASLGFDDVSADRCAPAIADYVLGVLEKYNCQQACCSCGGTGCGRSAF